MKRRVTVAFDPTTLPSKPKSIDMLPVITPLPDCPKIFGPSRSWFYREFSAGNIKLVKIGRSTYGDTASILARIATLKSVSEVA